MLISLINHSVIFVNTFYVHINVLHCSIFCIEKYRAVVKNKKKKNQLTMMPDKSNSVVRDEDDIP